jgi:hypothetical protein
MRSSRSCWLSLDFDFFCREEEQWDWGHSERWSVSDALWIFRAVDHSIRGGDLFEETSMERYSDAAPEEFPGVLQSAGFRFAPRFPVVVADSHRFAFLHAADGSHILQFDAHHDMGYGVSRECLLKRNVVDCGDWMFHVLRLHSKVTMTQIYPTWKGLAEIEESIPEAPVRSFARRTRFGLFSEDLLRREARRIDGVFLAKSSSWSPPWHDFRFVALVDRFRAAGGVIATPHKDQEGGLDPLRVRSFSKDEVVRLVAVQRSLLETCRVEAR